MFNTVVKGVNFLRIQKRKIQQKMDDTLNNPKKSRGTDKPTRYIHIGYPKSASTAIQKGYLGRHNQLLHLGCGNKINKGYWDDHGYLSAEINRIVEIDLRYKNNFAYDKDEVKTVFDKYFTQAEDNKNIHAVGLSNENFCFSWHGGIDVVEKAKRLYDIFGSGTQIVVILRNQIGLINSLYKENIRFGYPGTFEDFLQYMWDYKDRNFTYEFCFENVIETYQKLFGEENLNILFFEDLKDNKSAFLKSFSDAIGVEHYHLNLDKEYNKQLNDKELAIKRKLNEQYPHTFGKGKYEIIDNHRYIPYYTDELKAEIPNDLYFDNKVRKHFNQLSNELSTLIDVPLIDINWESEQAIKLQALYTTSNQNLAQLCPTTKTKLEAHNYLNLTV